MKDLNVVFVYLVIYTTVIICSSACSKRNYLAGKTSPPIASVSELYNNFEGGVLFPDLRTGLDILWRASFIGKVPFKEHAAFFTPEGILICPNEHNTLQSASLSALPNKIEGNKLFVLFEGQFRQIIGIIHTHVAGLPTPAPRNDFQYSYIGIHNYVMSSHDLYDAFRDSYGREVTYRIGARNSYEKLPFHDLKISTLIKGLSRPTLQQTRASSAKQSANVQKITRGSYPDSDPKQ